MTVKNCSSIDETINSDGDLYSMIANYYPNSHPNNSATVRTSATTPLNVSPVRKICKLPLGLKLNKTKLLSSINDINAAILEAPKHSSANKHTAINFQALSLTIGSWKKESKRDADMAVKCFFKKQKMAWEFLDGNRKIKFEFNWCDIATMRATFPGDGGYLYIKLKNSPLFFREDVPEPKKHTTWKSTKDFTDRQASLLCTLELKFKPGVLEKHYSKIMRASPEPNLYLHPLEDKVIQDISNRLFMNSLICDDSQRPIIFTGDDSPSCSNMNNYTNEFVGMENSPYSINDLLPIQSVAMNQEEPRLNYDPPHGIIMPHDQFVNHQSQLYDIQHPLSVPSTVYQAPLSCVDYVAQSHGVGFQQTDGYQAIIHQQPRDYYLEFDYPVSVQQAPRDYHPRLDYHVAGQQEPRDYDLGLDNHVGGQQGL